MLRQFISETSFLAFAFIQYLVHHAKSILKTLQLIEMELYFCRFFGILYISYIHVKKAIQSPFKHFRRVVDRSPFYIMSQYLESISASKVLLEEGLVLPLPFILYRYNISFCCVGIRFLNNYKIEFLI